MEPRFFRRLCIALYGCFGYTVDDINPASAIIRNITIIPIV